MFKRKKKSSEESTQESSSVSSKKSPKEGSKEGSKDLEKTLSRRLFRLFQKDSGDDTETLLEELEELLLGYDLGVRLSSQIIEEIRRLQKEKKLSLSEIEPALAKILCERLIEPEPLNFETPQCWLIVGVNGVGKTTSIAKTAYFLKEKFSLSDKIFLVAGDTFRAGAIEQLRVWAKRLSLRLIAQQPDGDPAAVIFDGIEAAKANHTPLVIVDTAGRLHNRKDLMLELERIKKAIIKADSQRKILTLLVLDASVGQNGLQQAELFHESVSLDGVILSKCDSSAKGGVVFQLCERFHLPVYFLGKGEGIEDMELFNAETFSREFLEK